MPFKPAYLQCEKEHNFSCKKLAYLKILGWAPPLILNGNNFIAFQVRLISRVTKSICKIRVDQRYEFSFSISLTKFFLLLFHVLYKISIPV